MSITKTWILSLILVLSGARASAEALKSAPKVPPPENKLLGMHEVFYLPFSLDFKVGSTPEDVLPFVEEKDGSRMISLSEWQTLDDEWKKLRAPWAHRSLLQSTQVPVSSDVRISDHLFSHHISLTRRAFDKFSIPDQISLAEMLRTKPIEVQEDFRQLEFVKSFITTPYQDERFNFFIISASWCESCQEYRILLETYAKTFPSSDLVLHSVVVDDPKQEIFDSPLMKELFPDTKRFPGDVVPRFIAVQKVHGQLKVWQEGDALHELYTRFLEKHRGFMDNKVSLFQSQGRKRHSQGYSAIDPTVSWLAK